MGSWKCYLENLNQTTAFSKNAPGKTQNCTEHRFYFISSIFFCSKNSFLRKSTWNLPTRNLLCWSIIIIMKSIQSNQRQILIILLLINEWGIDIFIYVLLCWWILAFVCCHSVQCMDCEFPFVYAAASSMCPTAYRWSSSFSRAANKTEKLH